ncbi:MAG: methionine synthase [Methanosphaera sp.]|nr:methionine synthase [Methanosphaera sp.]
MNIITTVVGSYPTHAYDAKTFNERLSDSLGLYDPYRKAIVNAVTSFVKRDIDIICDGQVREDMVKIFAGKINGFKIVDNTAYIKGKITPAARGISTKDLHFAYKVAKSLDDRFELNASLDKIYAHQQRGIKGIITGPTTIVHSSIIDNFYSSKKNAIYDIAKALSYEAKELEKGGACAIQIDEPFISTGAEDIEVSKKAVEYIATSVDIPVILHVCGDLKDVLEDLLSFDVDILDFEFSGMPQNIKTLKKAWTPECDKQIGIGCLNTKLESVDDEGDVKKTVNDVCKIIDKQNILIDPDCGMRMLDEDVAKGKLEVIQSIRNNGV